MIRVVTSMNDDARRRKEKIVCNIFTGKPPPDIDEPQKHALSYQEYLFGMRQSIFALAPHGNNPETFRHWEAMEMGAIPISVWPPENLSYLKIWCNGRVGGKDDEQKDPLFDINTPLAISLSLSLPVSAHLYYLALGKRCLGSLSIIDLQLFVTVRQILAEVHSSQISMQIRFARQSIRSTQPN